MLNISALQVFLISKLEGVLFYQIVYFSRDTLLRVGLTVLHYLCSVLVFEFHSCLTEDGLIVVCFESFFPSLLKLGVFQRIAFNDASSYAIFLLKVEDISTIKKNILRPNFPHSL